MYKIFDMHTHIYPDVIAEKAVANLNHFYDFKAEGNGTSSQLYNDGVEFGIQGFLVLCVATNAKQITKVNDFCAQKVKAAREKGMKAYGFMGIHQDSNQIPEEIEHALSQGLSGVKIHPDIQGINIDDRKLYPVYEIMQQKDLPVYFHMGDIRPEYNFSSPKRLVKILSDFPHLRTIAAHLGGYTVFDEGTDLLSGNENIWFDTSSALWAISPEHAEKLISKLSSKRVFFGTDYPVKRVATEFKYFMNLNLTETQRNDILYNNAAEFLKII